MTVVLRCADEKLCPRQVDLGGSVHSVTSIKQCQAALQGLNAEEVKTCLDVEAAASVGSENKLTTEAHHCQTAADKLENKASFSSNFNDRSVTSS